MTDFNVPADLLRRCQARADHWEVTMDDVAIAALTAWLSTPSHGWYVYGDMGKNLDPHPDQVDTHFKGEKRKK